MQVKQTELSNSAIILTGVNFASGKATLTEESLPVLDETANSLILDRSAIVEIRGYTDNVGKAEDNQLLSERRAEAVRRYLISKGIAADRITPSASANAIPSPTTAQQKAGPRTGGSNSNGLNKSRAKSQACSSAEKTGFFYCTLTMFYSVICRF
jgi:flagellar motor protein MotB